MPKEQIPTEIANWSNLLRKGKIPNFLNKLLELESKDFKGDREKQYSRLHASIFLPKQYKDFQGAARCLMQYIDKYNRTSRSYHYPDDRDKEWLDNFFIQTALRACAEYTLKALFLKNKFHINCLKKGQKQKPLPVLKNSTKKLDAEKTLSLKCLRIHLEMIPSYSCLTEAMKESIQRELSVITVLGNNIIHASSTGVRRGDYVKKAYSALLSIYELIDK